MDVPEEVEGETEEAAVLTSAQLEAMLRHAAQMPSELDSLWSRALNGEAVASALDRLKMRLGIAVAGYLERTRSEHSEAPLPVDIPLNDSDWSLLGSGAFDLDALRGVADVIMISGIMDAVRNLEGPQLTVQNLVTGESENVWESGGFENFRAQLLLFANTLNAPSHHFTITLDRIESAQRCVRSGLPEAALLYLRLALPHLEALLIPAISSLESENFSSLDHLRKVLGDAHVGIDLLLSKMEGISQGIAPEMSTTTIVATDLSDRLVDVVNTHIIGVGRQ